MSQAGLLIERGASAVCWALLVLGRTVIRSPHDARRRLLVLVGCFACLAGSARAQDSAPVTVLDSPVAWQLFQQVEDQAKENSAEAARVCQRLLDGYADRIIPAERAAAGEEVTRYLGVAERVEHFLRTHPAVLDRYRQVEGPEADRLLAAGQSEAVAALRGMTKAGLRAGLALAERDLLAGRFSWAMRRLARMEGHPDLAREGDGDAGASDEGKSYWFLRGAAAAIAKRVPEREQAEARLRAMGLADDSPELGTIGRFASIEPRPTARAIDPLGSGSAPEKDDIAAGDEAVNWQPVWFEGLLGLPRLRTSQRGPFGDPAATRLEISALVVAPTVHGDWVYLSNGRSVVALDRLSHRERWRHSLENLRIETDPGPVADLASIAVGEGALVTYPGHASASGRDTAGRITCLDAASGDVRWEVPLAILPGTEFDELFPIGAPVIADGSVYAIARKLTSRFETVDYLLALALDSGALRFATYIAGAPGVSVQGLRPASSPHVADGSVYVLSSAGAICRVDAADGHIQWLQRYLVPVRAPRYPSEPWEMGGPVVIGESLFAVAPNYESVVIIATDSGRAKGAMPTGVGSTWGTPRYLIAAPAEGLLSARIYAVGGDIVAFDPERPNAALWSLTGMNGDLVAAREGSATRSGIRGRVQQAGELLVVPGVRDVLLVEREAGRVRGRIEIDGPANPVLVGPQLLLGQADGAAALMPGRAAERLMRERIARDPSDPESGLALVDLGLRTRNFALCVEAAEAAKQAIDGSKGSVATDLAREALVDRLLEVAALGQAGVAGAPGEENRASLVASMESAHAILAASVRSHRQVVRQALAWGDWKASQGDWNGAIEAVDRVLSDPALSTESVRRREDVQVMALFAAADRVRAWGADAASALAAREARAAAAYAAIDQADEAGLVAFAARAPFTDAGVEASIRAARIAIERRAWSSAWGLVQGALRTETTLGGSPLFDGTWGDARGPRRAARLTAAAIECAIAAGWERTGRAFADNMFATFGDLPLRIGDRDVTLGALRGERQPAAPVVGGTVGAIREVRGKVVRATVGAEALSSVGGVLLVEGATLGFYRLPEWTKAWETPITDRDPVILDVIVGPRWPGASLVPPGVGDGGAILLWQAPSDRDAIASWIRLDNGEVIASTPRLGELMPQEGLLEAGRPVNQQMPNGQPFVTSEVVPCLTSTTFVAVRRNGDAVGFDRRDLSTPRWSRKRLLDQVYEVDVCDWGIALGGRAIPDPRRLQRPVEAAGEAAGEAIDVEDLLRGRGEGGPSALTVFAPEDGATLGGAELAEIADPTWMELLETGELLVGSASNIVAYDLVGRLALRDADAASTAQRAVAGLPTRWRRETLETHHSVGGWRIGDAVILALDTDLRDAIVPIRLGTADEIAGRFRAPSRLDERRSELRAGGRYGDAIVLRHRDRIVSFDLGGKATGEDAIASEDRDYAAILEGRDQLVVVSNGAPRQIPLSDGSGLRFEYNYMLYRLSRSEGCRLLGPGIRVRTVGQRAERWAIVDGFVIVSTNGGSLAVPLSDP